MEQIGLENRVALARALNDREGRRSDADAQAAKMHKALRIIGYGDIERMREWLASNSDAHDQATVEKMGIVELRIWIARVASHDRLIRV